MSPVALTLYQGLAGDSNGRAIPGAAAVAEVIERRFDLTAVRVGDPDPILDTHWDMELTAASIDLEGLAFRLDRALDSGARLVTALTRCAASLATLPVVVRHRPGACVVWFDAHADLNTPDTSTTGYLGGMALAGPAGLWSSGLGDGLSLANVVLVGVRDMDPAEQQVIDHAPGLVVVNAGPSTAADLRAAVDGRPVYVHVDCDVLVPDILPTDYAVDGGLTLAQLEEAAAALAEGEVIGLEIAEFENAWHDGGTAVSPAPLLDALDPLLRRLAQS